MFDRSFDRFHFWIYRPTSTGTDSLNADRRRSPYSMLPCAQWSSLFLPHATIGSSRYLIFLTSCHFQMRDVLTRPKLAQWFSGGSFRILPSCALVTPRNYSSKRESTVISRGSSILRLEATCSARLQRGLHLLLWAHLLHMHRVVPRPCLVVPMVGIPIRSRTDP